MKGIDRITQLGGLAAALVIAVAVCVTGAQAGEAKKFTETGWEYVVTPLQKDALVQPLFVEARAAHGPDTVRWSGVLHQFTENNVGGKGSSVAFEQVHRVTPSAEVPTGTIVYAMKYEVLANGDRLVMAGKFIPQLDGSYVADMPFVSAECTGRFAGATGTIDDVRAIPGGFVLAGTINIVRPTAATD